MSDEISRETGDEQRVSRLSLSTPPKTKTDVVPDSTADAAPAGQDDVVREYEERYYGSAPRKEKLKTLPRSYSTMRVTDDEKLWAAVAHGSIWVTLLAGILSVGFVVPVTIFFPLVVYFAFRKRSNYIAFHALQAFVVQLIATVGALALLIVGGIVWAIGLGIGILLTFVLVGIVLLPLWGIIGVVFFGIVAALPLVALFYGTVAAVHTHNGRDYRYPFIAQWVDRQLAGGLLNAV